VADADPQPLASDAGYLPVETVVKSRQEDYYRVLGRADAARDCSEFLEFMLDAIAESLLQATFIGFTGTPIELQDASTRVVFGD